MKKRVLLLFLILFQVISAFRTGDISGDPKTKSALGELLFKEKKLSKQNKLSCASCHIPEFAFADTIAFSIGENGQPGRRNTPSAMNVSARPFFFYDGRATSLEEQVSFPVEDHLEMNLSFAKACEKIRTDKKYIRYFREIYNELPDERNIRDAIASFERTLETDQSPFDRWIKGDSSAMTASAVRGRNLFMDDKKTKCFLCHFSPDFTGDQFRNIGLYDGKALNDAGRFEITCDSNDLGRFKTPGLRNVAVTAPYMHNGMFATLKEVLEYYNDPFKVVMNPVNTDTLMQQPLGLTEKELADLESFLHALTDKRFLPVKR